MVRTEPWLKGRPRFELEGPLQSSQCPAIPEMSSLGWSQSPAIENSIFAIHTIATGFWIFGSPDAIQVDCTPIGPKLCPLRFHLDSDPRPQVGTLTQDSCLGILCNTLDTLQSEDFAKAGPVNYGCVNLACGTNGKLLKHNPIDPQLINPDCGGIS